ncbi:MAG TPA: HK97 family phage prohead protease [Dissulfurispiraceae bacterium]|nr:HK97 family phage prohead protease [Dissulfurispiraceae bacterium]
MGTKLIENRNFEFRIESLADTAGTFEGYASVFDELVPSYEEIVDRGAFKKTLKDNGGRVPIFYMHSPFELPSWLGMGTEASEDSHGLAVRGKLVIEESETARTAWALMKLSQEVKRPAGLSIGFRTITEYMKDSLRHLKEVALAEYSLTPPGFQAAPNAGIVDVRSAIRSILVEMGELKAPAEPGDKSTQNQAAITVAAPQDLHAVSQALDPVFQALDRLMNKLRRR